MSRSQEEFFRLVVAFIRQNSLAVLSYMQNDDQPSGACADFVVLPGSGRPRLGFSTSVKPPYRKVPALRRNPKVAVTFFSGVQNKTVQCQGIVREVGESELRTQLEETFEEARFFTRKAGAVFFEVDLTWIRYADYGNNEEPFDLQEISF
ncbi:MAG: hypothetical protein C5B53_05620 [Candidatus Melainabacteria bacterium]|nr:MAG: hypothetical protein C5B53_05620 [Candidatus Melainabacteria bacterium]